jgi:adenylate cyclase
MRWLILLACAASAVWADEKAAEVRPPSPFAVVMIDAATEARLGAFPYDRGVYTKGIEALAAAGARGVVLKVFIDRAKSAEGDAALVAAMGKVKVIVQARLDDAEAKPNVLPWKFRMKDVQASSEVRPAPLEARAGWVPIPAVAGVAYDLGFIDSTPSIELVPVAVKYRGVYYKSLYTAALELAGGKPASMVAGSEVKFGEKSIGTDARCFAGVKLPAADGLVAHSFVDLLDGKVPAEALKDRVVILGYDGARMPANETAIGKVKGHRCFCYQLFSLWERLGA